MLFRVTKVDMDGFLGRDHHPDKEDEGKLVRALKMELLFISEKGQEDTALEQGEQVLEAAKATLFDVAADTCLGIWTCAMPDMTIREFLDFELEVYTDVTK
jgi:hypothetical protein